MENVNQQVVELTADMKNIEDDVLDLKLNKNVASDRTSEDFVASSLRTDVAGKFSILDYNTYISGVKYNTFYEHFIKGYL